MKTTYLIETEKGGTVLGYYRRLCDAKWDIERRYPNALILRMVGPYFGEGWHKYRLAYRNGKYTRIK